ncbi:Neprosin activation peptide [Arabidopsis suecica]|uniref:Neprosin activation peptide n=1 Tax=Arabidopsis suecica TaxID=45249 RepID=A0A8T1YNT2_ARASU|nr:Neprosin activation peptide [Arabidopsis suecica]
MEVKGPMIRMFLMCCIFGNIIINHNNDFVEAKSLSKVENLEIEKRLRTINKPAVKIIKSIDGKRYGCVDFFKQPGFDHPSMQNHTYHYKMRPIWKGMRERNTNNTVFGYLWENGVGCPIGTVPIQRVTKDDLLRFDSFGDNHKPRGSWNTTTYDPNSPLHPDQHHYAVARTFGPDKRFNGATMDLCITAPAVKPTQFSASRLHIQLGSDFIQTGFTVNPALYKDSQPRTYVYTNSGGKSCYNSNCDVGMILVRQDFPLGLALKPVSVRGAKKSEYGIFGLIKDEINGNWWLQFGDAAEEIGFWPSSRFPQSSANLVEWGGEVYSASLPSPEMGYGYFLAHDMVYDAYIKRISVLDGFNNIDRIVQYTEKYVDDTHGYQVIDDYKNSKYPRAGHIIFFGGPGNI